MEDLPIGAEVTLKVVENEKNECNGCFFSSDMNHTCNNPYKNNEGDDMFECRKSNRSDSKDIIFKEVKE